FVAIGLCGMAQTDSAMVNFQRNLPITDIVETLSECDCMILSMRGDLTAREEKLVSRGQAILFGRYFSELDSLFDHGSDLIQLYAFGGICITYPDSLNDKHLQILKKEGTVRIYEQGKDSFPTKPIIRIAGMMYQSVAQIKLEKEQQQFIQKMISEFILKYASNPNTYVNISFQDYHVYSAHEGASLEKVKSSEVYSVKHIFKIQNNDGSINEYQARFKIDSELKVMLIEEEKAEESNTVSCYPPRLNWWLENFGRKLNKKEKKELGIEN
ncbi:MAG: hypothetical protein IT222_00655, partial [Crocinitomix sp.]|nr:hypothetical protein [Crocinitomix sp.]